MVWMPVCVYMRCVQQPIHACLQPEGVVNQEVAASPCGVGWEASRAVMDRQCVFAMCVPALQRLQPGERWRHIQHTL